MTSPAFSELIKDLQQEMGTVTEIKDSNRASPFKDHLNMVAEGMGGLQWVVFEGKPADYVAEILGGVQLFGNRVLKEYKEKSITTAPRFRLHLADHIPGTPSTSPTFNHTTPSGRTSNPTSAPTTRPVSHGTLKAWTSQRPSRKLPPILLPLPLLHNPLRPQVVQAAPHHLLRRHHFLLSTTLLPHLHQVRLLPPRLVVVTWVLFSIS